MICPYHNHNIWTSSWLSCSVFRKSVFSLLYVHFLQLLVGLKHSIILLRLQPMTTGDIDPAVLASLPPSMQLDLLVQVKGATD
jgi:hypothetical protein